MTCSGKSKKVNVARRWHRGDQRVWLPGPQQDGRQGQIMTVLTGHGRDSEVSRALWGQT